ncbi:MAG: hypothetical protein AB1513_00025 [Pseudomonadota bacterium]
MFDVVGLRGAGGGIATRVSPDAAGLRQESKERFAKSWPGKT